MMVCQLELIHVFLNHNDFSSCLVHFSLSFHSFLSRINLAFHTFHFLGTSPDIDPIRIQYIQTPFYENRKLRPTHLCPYPLCNLFKFALVMKLEWLSVPSTDYRHYPWVKELVRIWREVLWFLLLIDLEFFSPFGSDVGLKTDWRRKMVQVKVNT